MSSATATPSKAASFTAPFRHTAFTVIWTATVVSNVGGWMYSAASGWLMTGLNPDPLIVALVQAASSLPICLFATPAGALADIFDKRKYLIVVESLYTALAAVYAAMVGLGLATPVNLLLFTLVLGAAGALTSPAWQAAVPQLVPKDDLSAAIAANSVGVNISRAIGPALGGATISAFGIVAPSGSTPFPISALSARSCGGAKRAARARCCRPSVSAGAMLTGFRYARHNFHLRCTLMRAVGFFLFASAYWALLPLVARRQIAGGPSLYGVLLGVIGAGAVGGAFFLPWLKAKLGPNRLMALGALGQALAMVLYGLAREPVMALAAGLIAGASWIAALATLSVSAQVALPDWVRGRGLALYTTVFFGCLTLGSAVWGEVAAWLGLPAAHFLAAAGAVAAIPLTWRFKLQTGAGIDLSPSMHWPAPITTQSIANDRGPVLVTVEYGSIRKTGRRFSKRLPSSSMCGAATAPMPGASSKTPPNRAACSRRSWSNPGWSICASTSASPKPIASCRMPSTVSTKTASPRSRTSSPPSLKAAVSQVPIDRNLDQAGHGQTP